MLWGNAPTMDAPGSTLMVVRRTFPAANQGTIMLNEETVPFDPVWRRMAAPSAQAMCAARRTPSYGGDYSQANEFDRLDRKDHPRCAN